MSAYDGVSLVLFPFSIALGLCTLPGQWRASRRARRRDERLYWRLSFYGHAIVSVGLFFTSLWMLDQLVGEPLRVGDWWPSPSRELGWQLWGDDAALADLLLALCVGLLPMLAAGYFGYVDENGEWHRPEWRRYEKRRRDAEG